MAPPGNSEQPHVYVSLLKCFKTLDVDWKQFAAEIGIKSTGNAQRKLKETLKKDGLQLLGGRIVSIDGEVPPGKFKTPEKSEKRKKGEDDGDQGDAFTTPTKKARARAPGDKESHDEDAC